MDDYEKKYTVGDLVVILYDCWLHSFEGSVFVRRGDLGIVIGKREDPFKYKPLEIFTSTGDQGWVYVSNIKVLEKTS